MTIRYAVLAASALALVAGCGSTTAAEPRSPSPSAGGRTLTVHTQILPGRHGAMFTEGALPEIRLVADDGTTVRPVRDHEDTAVFAHLTPGRYLVTAALRPCDGNCGYLDPATSHCTKVVHVSRDLTYAVTWKVGADCSVRAA